ncbi:hypothetical protein IMZ48_34755 [Candidatus Bathyarchaeota archaeon]|nr:hypothetical protein [Candidatus Bathyarchaeota archaeon]
MIGTSCWDYVFIRTCIFFLHHITPLSVLHTLTATLVHPPYYIPPILEAWLALEAAFYLIVYLPRKAYLQTPAIHPETPSREDRRTLFERCQRHIPNPENYMRKWFQDAPAAEIKRENVHEFFRWAFFNKAEPDPAYDEELQEYTRNMEGLLGRKFEDGRGNAKCLRLTLEEVDMLHRSLIWYLVSFIYYLVLV